MYTQWDMSVRELGGGVWFFTNFALALVLFAWGFRQCCSKQYGQPIALVMIAFAISEMLFGSAIRGFLTWQQFRVAGNGGDPTPWIATWPFLGSSIIMNIMGAALCMWLILPERWRAPITVATTIVAITVPTSIFIFR
jgi:hypothetical protein